MDRGGVDHVGLFFHRPMKRRPYLNRERKETNEEKPVFMELVVVDVFATACTNDERK